MRMKKICPRCRSVVIDADQPCCQRCADKGERRHREYDRFRRDKRAAAFYHSPEWAHMAAHIRQVQGGVDLWALHEERRIVTDDLCVHHIVELADDWSKRLAEDNLFLCSGRTHALIHKLYRQDKAGTQARLREILSKQKLMTWRRGRGTENSGGGPHE